MIVLYGHSGSGKSTLERMLKKRGLKPIISYTTRKPREGEVDGVNYHFIDRDKFNKLLNDGFFAEWVEYRNNLYGTAKIDCTDDRVIVVEPHGLEQLKENKDLNVIAIFLNVPENIRAARMLDRGDSFEVVTDRIYGDRVDFKDSEVLADYIIDATNDLAIILKKVLKIAGK